MCDSETLVWQVICNIWTWIWKLVDTIGTIWQSIIDVWAYAIWIFKAIFFGIWSLCTSVFQLAYHVFESNVFNSVSTAFEYVSGFIWWPATIFISTMLFVIIVRIAVAFVFKLFRLNIDYHRNQSQLDAYNKPSCSLK